MWVQYAENRIDSKQLEVSRVEAQGAFREAKHAAYVGEAEAEFCDTAAYQSLFATLYAVAAARVTVMVRLEQGIELLDAFRYEETDFNPHNEPRRGCDYWARAAVGASEKARVFVAHGVAGNEHPTSASVQPAASAAKEAIKSEEAREQARLVRHIIGNPFRPYSACDHWPATVICLADAFYNGQDCGFALHDVLLDAGHADLAEHFRDESDHPKGCWVLDLLLGKE